MKKSLMLAVAVILVAGLANAGVIVSDDFSYADGSLVGNGGWASHSGTEFGLQVVAGQAVVDPATSSEDVNLQFTPVGGKIYFAFDFAVDDLGTPWVGTDSEYFAHFWSSSFAYRGRLDIVPATGGGDFTLGFSTKESTADLAWPLDLSYGVVYQVVVSYDQDANIAQLWVDAAAEADFSIVGIDAGAPGDSIEGFALRNSFSSMNEVIRIDNLVVADDCADVFGTCAPVATEDHAWGSVKSLFR